VLLNGTPLPTLYPSLSGTWCINNIPIFIKKNGWMNIFYLVKKKVSLGKC
jgi:hypothetical protein